MVCNISSTIDSNYFVLEFYYDMKIIAPGCRKAFMKQTLLFLLSSELCASISVPVYVQP